MTELGTNNHNYWAYAGGAIYIAMGLVWAGALPLLAVLMPSIYPFLRQARMLNMLSGLKWNQPDIPPMLYLSDGGHTENLGLLTLLTRRLSRIVVVCGADDPQLKCLTSAIEQARAKLGVTFTVIRADQIRRNVSRISDELLDIQTDIQFFSHDSQRVMVLKVHYPSSVRSWVQGCRKPGSNQGSNGYVYFLKPIPDHPAGYVIPRTGHDVPDDLMGAKCVQRLDQAHHTLAGCCCTACHRMPCLRSLSGRFPFHSTAFQFFTPTLFDAYHVQGAQAMMDAFGVRLKLPKADVAGTRESEGYRFSGVNQQVPVPL